VVETTSYRPFARVISGGLLGPDEVYQGRSEFTFHAVVKLSLRYNKVALISQIFICVCFHRDRSLTINSDLIEAFSAAVR
jgi:hypothetical protein